MEIDTIKNIPIRNYLSSLGVYPVRDYGSYGMYKAIARGENDASLKVDYNKNLWRDFGSGNGGSIIDLVIDINKCNFKDAVKMLENSEKAILNFCDLKGEKESVESREIVIHAVRPLQKYPLLNYIKDRGVDIEVAKQYCVEVDYSSKKGNKFYGIGFRNNSSGYEIRNQNFKGATSKDITVIDNGFKSCVLFEGFFNFLSYKTMTKDQPDKHNYVILNSTALGQRAYDYVKSHSKVYSFHDDDDSGKKLFKTFNTALLLDSVISLLNKEPLKEVKMVDSTPFHKGFNDLNDFLKHKHKSIKL